MGEGVILGMLFTYLFIYFTILLFLSSRNRRQKIRDQGEIEGREAPLRIPLQDDDNLRMIDGLPRLVSVAGELRLGGGVWAAGVAAGVRVSCSP